MISVRQLVKHYGSNTVLQGIDFESAGGIRCHFGAVRGWKVHAFAMYESATGG